MERFRFSDFFSPRRLLYWRWLLWRSQHYSSEKLRELQWRLLSGLLDHCFQRVPYYRELFAELELKRSDFTSPEDISKIPILSKEMLLEHNDELKADNLEHYHPSEPSTSGTTGTPMRIYWDRDSNILELLCQWRHFSWLGYRLGEPFLDISSPPYSLPGGYRWNWKCKGFEVHAPDINASNIETYVKFLRTYRIKFWRGFPSSIDYFCRLLEEAGIEDIKPAYIVTIGEPLLDHQRAFIESWAGVPVCDNYGLMEHTALICQCPEGGYHIASEYGLVEITKDDGIPAQPGEEGRILTTGLHNKAFPLLRYETEDYAIQSERICSCGKTLPLIEKLTGRFNDRVMSASGKWVSGLHVTREKEIRALQLVQEDISSVDVYVVPTENYNNDTDRSLRLGLQQKFGETLDIRIYRVSEVPFRKPGKFRSVICKVTTSLLPDKL